MVALNTPVCEFGAPAIDFRLKDTNGELWTLNKCKGEKGLLVMFICNHCPYVKSIIDDLVATVNILKQQGINSVAIMSNNWHDYPDDAPEKMLKFRANHQFQFPYLIDETQEIAKKYGAVCTPDFFGYNANLELQYRGRFDARARDNTQSGSNELEKAMLQIAESGLGPRKQYPSIGCSIKWKEN